MRHLAAIVVAAGKSTRFKLKPQKPLAKLGAATVINHSLAVLNRHPAIKEIIVVVNPRNRQGILKAIKKSGLKKFSSLVLGGRRRQDSVENGLKAVSEKADFVLVHDAARPLIEEKSVSAVINAARKSGAAVLGVPVKNTLKEVVSCRLSVVSKMFVRKTLERNNIWEVQTPQVFRKELIAQAYKKFGNTAVTDDASLVEKLGKKVSVVPGSYNNIKITTSQDLMIAEAILRWNTK